MVHSRIIWTQANWLSEPARHPAIPSYSWPPGRFYCDKIPGRVLALTSVTDSHWQSVPTAGWPWQLLGLQSSPRPGPRGWLQPGPRHAAGHVDTPRPLPQDPPQVHRLSVGAAPGRDPGGPELPGALQQVSGTWSNLSGLCTLNCLLCLSKKNLFICFLGRVNYVAVR